LSLDEKEMDVLRAALCESIDATNIGSWVSASRRDNARGASVAIDRRRRPTLALLEIAIARGDIACVSRRYTRHSWPVRSVSTSASSAEADFMEPVAVSAGKIMQKRPM
jgi:hypothetical protein